MVMMLLRGLGTALLGVLSSKKVLTAIVGFAASRWIPWLTEEMRLQIVALAGLVIAGFAASDHGKEAAKVSASLAPAVTAPSVSGGVPQVVDSEDPVKDRR